MDFLDGGRDRFGEAVGDVEPGNPAQLCQGAGPPFFRVFHELLVLAFQFFRLAFDAGFDRCQLLEVHGVSFVFDEYPALVHHGDLVSVGGQKGPADDTGEYRLPVLGRIGHGTREPGRRRYRFFRAVPGQRPPRDDVRQVVLHQVLRHPLDQR